MTLREYLYIASTRSICEFCLQSVPAKIIKKGGKIFLLKHCETHGLVEDILEDDADYYLSRINFEKPGNIFEAQTEFKRGCPFDCGLCPDHEQHTCLGLIEITEKCNLGCPVCYAHSGVGKSLDLGTIEKMLDFFVESEGGEAEILQISGGEPFVHEEIFQIIKLARNKKIKFVMINTNGLKLAEDEGLARQLGEFKGNFEIYLQFDSLNDDNYLKIRGKKLTEIKKKALENLAKYEVPTTLVATMEQGVNDSEFGDLVEFAMNTPFVRGINFQPVAFFGRLREGQISNNRLTLTGAIHKIEEQTNGMVKKRQFVPLPCNTDRVSINYFVKDRDGGYQPIAGMLKVQNYLEVLDNTLIFKAEDLSASATKNLLPSGVCNCFNFIKDINKIIPKGFSNMNQEQKLNFVNQNTFRITVTSFVDVYNFEERAMKKECVHVITPDLKKIPFSSFNMIHRKRYQSV